MLEQWLPIPDHYLPIPPYCIFNLLKEDICLRVSQEGMPVTPYVDPSEHTINIGGADYHSEITETDRVLTFTGLDDYDTLFCC